MTDVDTRQIADQMIVCLARLLRNDEVVFHGVASPLPMVATLLAKHTHAPDLIYVSIAGGVDANPDQLGLSTVDPHLLDNSRSMITLTDLFDLAASGRMDTAFLSGVQIDRQGRINMSVIGPFDRPKVRLPGGAGSAAIMPRARRTILWRTRHDPRSFVNKLDFVTADGRVDRVVTPLCVFRRVNGQLAVETRHRWASLERLHEQTGFSVDVDTGTPVTIDVTDDERSLIRRIDPMHVALSEF